MIYRGKYHDRFAPNGASLFSFLTCIFISIRATSEIGAIYIEQNQSNIYGDRISFIDCQTKSCASFSFENCLKVKIGHVCSQKLVTSDEIPGSKIQATEIKARFYQVSDVSMTDTPSAKGNCDTLLFNSQIFTIKNVNISNSNPPKNVAGVMFYPADSEHLAEVTDYFIQNSSGYYLLGLGSNLTGTVQNILAKRATFVKSMVQLSPIYGFVGNVSIHAATFIDITVIFTDGFLMFTKGKIFDSVVNAEIGGFVEEGNRNQINLGLTTTLADFQSCDTYVYTLLPHHKKAKVFLVFLKTLYCL